MPNRFVSFLLVSRWTSVIMALMYHVRFLLFVDYEDVRTKTGLSKAFYFLTGLGHESFAVFFVLDGILTGLMLRRGPPDTVVGRHVAGLYRLLLPGLILGAVLDVMGARFLNGSGLYTAYPAFSTLTLSYTSLLGNLLMLQPFVVPTFGSNGMLYLLSYLFWSLVLLALVLHARRLVQVLLLAAVILLVPFQFVVWATIWMSGLAVAWLGATHDTRPPLAVALAGFVGALLLSRIVGADTHVLPPPFGAWLIQCKYLLVGVSFAVVALAVYPARAFYGATAVDRNGSAAAFTFFFHFPVMMLLVATGATLLGHPLMQQPTTTRYGEFVAVVAACVGTTALVTRASAAL